jgi:hypothetical protein
MTTTGHAPGGAQVQRDPASQAAWRRAGSGPPTERDPDSEWTARAVASGLAAGLLVLALFAAGWFLAGLGVSGVDGLPRWIGLAFTLLVTGGLASTGIKLLVAANHLASDSSPAAARRGRRVGMQFGLVFGAEFVLIAVASRILAALGQDSLIMPVIAAIVGAHFLPLAGLFHVRTYSVTGGILIGIGLAAVVGVLASPFDTFWQAAVGFASALVLWITAAVIARLSWHLSRSAAA